MIPDFEFNALWDALMDPIKALERDVANLRRQAGRSEVAGAVEVVAALPSAGEMGRLLYLSAGGGGDGLYVDNGSSWVGPLS